MGISKLTSYMEDKENGPPGTIWTKINLDSLPGGRLVIDGNSLVMWLYHSFRDLPAAALFGGPYPTYYQMVTHFFTILKEYGVHPVIVFDGIKCDTKTGRNRKGNAIKMISKYQMATSRGCSGLPPPLMLKEVFLDAVDSELAGADVHFASGEADAELVAIANSLGCPVLSNDSDFFVYKIASGYIPLTHLTISEECELQSPVTDDFLVNHFERDFKMKDEDLRLLLPAMLGNDNITPQAIPELDPPDVGVSQVFRYANKFASYQECLEVTKANNPRLFSNLQLAHEQYQNLPPPSYPYDPTAEVPAELSRLPLQYHHPFRKGCFQTFMGEAAVHRLCMLRVVFEDITSEGVHSAQSISLPIRKAIYHILECSSPVTEVRRGSLSQLDEVRVEFSGLPPITHDKIPARSRKARRSIILSIMQCEKSNALIESIHREWQLPIATTIYWFAQGQCAPDFAKALVACFVACHLSTVPSQAEPISPPTKGTPELEMVHKFAQWQCAYFDAVALNQLLMEPFQYVSPAKLFDGEVAAYYYRHRKNIDRNLRSQSSEAHELYHHIVGAILTPERCERRSKKPAAEASQPFTQNRFSKLATRKDSKK